MEEGVLACLSRVYPFSVPQFKSWSTKLNISFVLVVLVLLPFTHGYSLRKKREVCEYGNYTHEGKTCCLCPKGFYVHSHCNTSNTQPVCEPCETGKTYTYEANFHRSCDQCTVCRREANLQRAHPCTVTSNAVCECMKGYFCEGESCEACQPCKTCEWGEKEPCTASNNVVCKEAGTNSNRVIVAVIIATLLVVAAGVAVFVLWKRRLLCFGQQEQEPDPVEMPLRGVDLSEYVSDIVDDLSWREMVRVANKTGMNPVQVERCKHDHKTEEEQTRALLNAWIQEKGLDSSETFIQALRKCHLNHKADKFKRQMIEGRQ